MNTDFRSIYSFLAIIWRALICLIVIMYIMNIQRNVSRIGDDPMSRRDCRAEISIVFSFISDLPFVLLMTLFWFSSCYLLTQILKQSLALFAHICLTLFQFSFYKLDLHQLKAHSVISVAKNAPSPTSHGRSLPSCQSICFFSLMSHQLSVSFMLLLTWPVYPSPDMLPNPVTPGLSLPLETKKSLFDVTPEAVNSDSSVGVLIHVV